MWLISTSWKCLDCPQSLPVMTKACWRSFSVRYWTTWRFRSQSILRMDPERDEDDEVFWEVSTKNVPNSGWMIWPDMWNPNCVGHFISTLWTKSWQKQLQWFLKNCKLLSIASISCGYITRLWPPIVERYWDLLVWCEREKVPNIFSQMVV